MNDQGRSGPLKLQPEWAEFPDPGVVADRIAVVMAKGAAILAVPGGRTPAPILAALLDRRPHWEGSRFFLTDDRNVPVDHPASNEGSLRRALAGTEAAIEPLATDLVPPPFDLVWIGMGEDGHVASIFPNAMDVLGEEPAVARTVPDPLPPEAPFERTTLTLGALANCKEMILVFSGERKKKVLEDALAGRSDLPITRLLRRLETPLTIYWKP